VILANGSLPVAQLLDATRSIPIVFAQVNDPVSAGFVQSLSRPGGNATGFSLIEYGVVGKWLELIKQVAPRASRIAVLRSPQTPSGVAQLAAMHVVAPSFGVSISLINVIEADDIERGITDAARQDNVALVITTSAPMIQFRELIIRLAARYKLPAIFPYRFFVTAGGLMSYGHDAAEAYRGAARYVDRILKGEKPADLPVQQPTVFHLAVNLKTAKALDLTVPATLLARADEVIE
jgi:putative ABC transport system substrate-binding protein